MSGNIAKNYRPDIDGLRAIAVLFVVFFHTFPNLLVGGFIGVDIFFVISGYLITSIIYATINNDTFSIIHFYRRRIQRIFPALLLVLASAGLFGWATLLPDDFSALSQYIAAGAAFVSNFLLYNESGYFEKSIELKPLMHLWSLGVEEQFYLLWPVIISVVAIYARKYFTTVIFVLLCISLSYGLFETHRDPSLAFYSPISRFWELMAGAMLATNSRKWVSGKIDLALASLGAVFVLASGLVIQGQIAFPGFWALLPVVGAGLIIASGPATFIHTKLLSHPWLVAIGLISYPLYLWHWVILSFIRIHAEYPAWPLRVAGIGLSFVLATATYFFVERKLRHSQRQIVPLTLLPAMLVVGAISLGVAQFGWFVRPLSNLEQQLMQTYNPQPAYRYKRCFLDPLTQTGDNFAPECMPAHPVSKRLVLLWGDSLAAQFYPGLKQISDKTGEFDIVQRTAGSCPPGLEQDQTNHGNCDAINAATRAFIIKQRPKTVVLNGRWENGRDIERGIPQIIRFLRENGASKIVLAGPTPDWWPDLKKLLLRDRFTRSNLPQRIAPPRSVWKNTVSTEERLRAVAQQWDITFLSPINAFCKNDTCLIRVSDDIPDGLIASDHDHLTQQASEFLFEVPEVRRIFSEESIP